ncbi:hypothetical protein BROUX41_004865 [Berkeleyomyces rouxiae]|uniref:uncharacterized protein n=1 Tax=Berkeleyomyces rouxiae TaxID=2035830 RepID=UPI003B7F72BF
MKRAREPEEACRNSDRDVVAVLHPVSKAAQIDRSVGDTESDSSAACNMRCSLPPHKDPVSFRSYHDYEAHYARDHSYRCHECHRNLPSEHLLSVHIEECHDSFVALKRERGEKTFSCFVESCERKCSTPQKRRMHLIDKHLYPKNFFFAVTRDGIDGRSSLLHEGGHGRRRSSLGNTATAKTSVADPGSRFDQAALPSPGKLGAGQPRQDAPSISKSTNVPTTDGMPQSPPQTPDTEMEDLTDALSELKFVPRGIRFGRGIRAGFSRT